jgi:hypothetical protein
MKERLSSTDLRRIEETPPVSFLLRLSIVGALVSALIVWFVAGV